MVPEVYGIVQRPEFVTLVRSRRDGQEHEERRHTSHRVYLKVTQQNYGILV